MPIDAYWRAGSATGAWRRFACLTSARITQSSPALALFVDALNMKEYPILMGMIMFTALFVIVGNLIADILVALLDPRVRLA